MSKDNQETETTADAKALPSSSGSDRIVQISVAGVENTQQTQCNFLIVGLTESGKVVISNGDREWTDISPIPQND